MKIDACTKFVKNEVKTKLYRSFVNVPVDIDYVNADENEIIEWVLNELNSDDLSKMLGRPFTKNDINISNMKELIVDIDNWLNRH